MTTHTWTAPELTDTYILYDEDGTPARVGRYIDFLAEIEEDLWPRTQEDYELLLWSYNAEATCE